MESRKKNTNQPPILVTGGTGTLGRQVVARLRSSGHPVRILGRHAAEVEGGAELVLADLATGEGVDEALAGVDVVVHCAGSAKGDDVKARTLVEAAKRSGVRHLVYISVVGADETPINGPIDRAMFGYFGAKHAAERIIAESGIPWTTLRATQFHDLTFKTLEQLAKAPIMPVFGGMSFQPVDSGEVADRLVDLTLNEPAGLVPAIGGPRVYKMDDLARSYLEATGRSKPIFGMPIFGAAASAQKSGVNLAPDRAVGRRTWEEFLAEKATSQQVRDRAAA
ncbi:MAG: SDR family oxidoreductase [Chloroflexota bacterium]